MFGSQCNAPDVNSDCQAKAAGIKVSGRRAGAPGRSDGATGQNTRKDMMDNEQARNAANGACVFRHGKRYGICFKFRAFSLQSEHTE